MIFLMCNEASIEEASAQASNSAPLETAESASLFCTALQLSKRIQFKFGAASQMLSCNSFSHCRRRAQNTALAADSLCSCAHPIQNWKPFTFSSDRPNASL
jgi:hypothetical protein